LYETDHSDCHRRSIRRPRDRAGRNRLRPGATDQNAGPTTAGQDRRAAHTITTYRAAAQAHSAAATNSGSYEHAYTNYDEHTYNKSLADTDSYEHAYNKSLVDGHFYAHTHGQPFTYANGSTELAEVFYGRTYSDFHKRAHDRPHTGSKFYKRTHDRPDTDKNFYSQTHIYEYTNSQASFY
jgi:hypothetical protein